MQEKPSKQQQQRFRNLDYMPPAGGQADPQHQKMVADVSCAVCGNSISSRH